MASPERRLSSSRRRRGTGPPAWSSGNPWRRGNSFAETRFRRRPERCRNPSVGMKCRVFLGAHHASSLSSTTSSFRAVGAVGKRLLNVGGFRRAGDEQGVGRQACGPVFRAHGIDQVGWMVAVLSSTIKPGAPGTSGEARRHRGHRMSVPVSAMARGHLGQAGMDVVERTSFQASIGGRRQDRRCRCPAGLRWRRRRGRFRGPAEDCRVPWHRGFSYSLRTQSP